MNQRHLSENTIRVYRRHAFNVFADLGAEPLKIDKAVLRKHLSALAKPHAAGTWSALSDFYSFAYRKGLCADHPMQSLDMRRPRAKRRRFKRSLTRDELTRVLLAAVYCGHGNTRWTGQRMAWAILANYLTGLRPGELTKLTTDKVVLNGSASKIYIDDTKTGYDRVVPLSAVAVVAFRELIGDRRGVIFGIGRSEYWRLFQKYAHLAGIDPERCRPYALRHSFGRHLVEAGVPLPDVSALLGHVDLRQTIVYTEGDEPARRFAVRKLDDFADAVFR